MKTLIKHAVYLIVLAATIYIIVRLFFYFSEAQNPSFEKYGVIPIVIVTTLVLYYNGIKRKKE